MLDFQRSDLRDDQTDSIEIAVINDDPDTVDRIQLILQVGWPKAKLRLAELNLRRSSLIELGSARVVVLDLPGQSDRGLKILRALHAALTAPILVLISDNNERTVARIFDLGAQGCQVKPIRQMEFLARVKAMAGIFRKNHTGAPLFRNARCDFPKVNTFEDITSSPRIVSNAGKNLVGQCPKCSSILIYQEVLFFCPICGYKDNSV